MNWLKKVNKAVKDLLNTYKLIAQIIGIILSVAIPFISKVYHNDYYFNWSLMISSIVLWVILFLFFSQKIKSSIQTQHSFYRFRYRNRYILTISLLFVLGSIYSIYKLYKTRQNEENKIIVLIVPFKNETDTSKDMFSTQLYGELNEQLDTDKNIKLELLDKSISETEGGVKTAKEIAKERNAAVLIWGYYAKTSTNVFLKTRFEILDSILLNAKSDLKISNKNDVFKVEQLNDFELQKELTNSNSFLILSYLGYLKFIQNKWLEAISYFSKALNFKTNGINLSTVNFYKGFSFGKLKQNDSAMFYLNLAIKYNNKYVPEYIDLGTIYAENNQFDLSLKCFNEALYYDAYNIEAYNNIGVVYMKTNQYDLAYDNFMRAYTIYPADPTTLKNISTFVEFKISFDNTIEQYKKNKNQKGLYGALINRAKYLYLSKSYKEALVDINTGIKLFPDSAAFFILKGNIDDDGYQNKNAAILDYTHAIKLDPNNRDIYYNRGVVLKRQRRLNEAMADYNKSISIHPLAEAYNNRGGIYMDWKMYEKAYKNFKLAVEISPIRDSSEYKDHMRAAESLMEKR